MALPVGMGDASDAFARFHDAYARRVRGLARHLLGADAAVDDVVQETLWRAYRKGLHHGDGRDPWPWLATVTRNACHDVHRSRREHPGFEDDRVVDESPESSVVDAARREHVVGALERLPVRQRHLLLLRHVDGVRCDEIASSEGSSVDAVKSALARARVAFRSCYDGWRGLVPWGVGPAIARIRSAMATTRWPVTPRSGFAGGLATLFALGLLAPPGATGSDRGDRPDERAPSTEAVPRGAADLTYLQIAELSPAETPAAAPPTSQPGGGQRVASPPPTRRDARPAPGPVLEPADPSGDDVEVLDLVDPGDLPDADEVVHALDDSVDVAVATADTAVDETVETSDAVPVLDETVDVAASTLL